MKLLKIHNGRGRHRIGSQLELTEVQVNSILDLIHQPVEKAQRVLGGRRTVTQGELDGIGKVAVKHFARGGLLGKVISSKYLRIGKIRSLIEFELLERARELGINAPEPIAFIYSGGICYQTWLISRFIENYSSLAEVFNENTERGEQVMPAVSAQIEKMIQAGLFHIDLHPGNVLVDGDNKVYFIDFDKAHEFRGCRNALRDKYLCRWRRAVIKHSLPEVLAEIISAGLRKDFSRFDQV